jgi:hypothetical protein
MRFGLTSALMGDGFYSYTVGGSGAVLRYDEYDNGGIGRGYLGRPLGAMRSAVAPLSTPDLLGGYGSFADNNALSAWTLYSRPGYSATRELDDGAVKIDVSQSAGELTGVELRRGGIPVTAGAHYTLSFRARADRPLSVQTEVQQGVSPWTSYMAAYDDKMQLTTEWRTFELPMMSSGTDSAATFKLTMGQAVGTVWVDDVKLQAGDRNVYRRDYDGGVALVNPTDRAVTVDLGANFRKIRGAQVPSVNDGSLVNAVTLAPKDGVVLVRPTPGDPPQVPTVTKTPASVSRVKVRKTLTLSGNVAPALAGGTVTIVKTRLVGRRWRAAGTSSVRLVNGSYRYSFKPNKRGSWRFVAKYWGSWNGATGYSASKSGVKTVRVR